MNPILGKSTRLSPLSIPALVLALATSCGGGGGGAPAPAAPPNPSNPSLDLTGTWQIRDEVLQASGVCAGEVGRVEIYSLSAVQNGSSLTVTTPAGTFQGTVSGSTVRWSGSYPDQGGTTTLTNMALQATSTTISGQVQWTWSDGSSSCSGVSRVEGTKTSSTPLVLGSGEVLLLHPRYDEAIALTAAPAGSPATEAVLVGLLESGASSRFDLPPGAWDLRLVRLEAEEGDPDQSPDQDADPRLAPLVEEFPDVELGTGPGVLLVVEQ